MRFSKYFRLGKKQPELDFVDIPLNTDIPLFLDPYALEKRNDLFSQQCNNIVVNFFQKVIDDIRKGDYKSAKYNLNLLGEPNETHLGLSCGIPMGKGVSGKQSVDFFDRLKSSKAVLSGFLKDLSDCELVIPGISRDKISDIVTNIIKIKLLEYTEQQCNTYGIFTQSIASGRFWNPQSSSWDSKYINLPVYKTKRLILVPKALVRYSLEYNHRKYYNNFVLEYLQEENINANTSLVRLLKNGDKVVYKKDLKNEPQYKLTKEFLYEFSKNHPGVLEKYVSSLPEKVLSLTNEEIEVKQKKQTDFDIDLLISNLKSIVPGRKTADQYHNLMVGILEVIFYPNLYSPVKEDSIHNGRKRIDITYQNAAKIGFFEFLANNSIACPFVICECKNYNDDPNNPELDQISGRFSPRRGKFGILACRKIENRTLMTQRCRDTANDDRGFVVALDDSDIIRLLGYRKNSDDTSIDEFLTGRYKELVMN